ncbi:MAG: leucine--tRNA ligase, partial [Verrucomicrobia bacterium]|nr:leucine--tRNA ligase [Verrucomicrobiota bacterium]
MRKYNHKEIEPKWQHTWEKEQTFKVSVDHNKPKYYVLDMFPYPSGAGLHVGHVEGYTATDIVARWKRMKGFNVLHPMGWDSFGLPAEQYAVRTGTHPSISTKANIDVFRRQLKSLGFSYDWSREIATSDATYYKWTQWIFAKLYEKGLAYEAEMSVNYCPALGTVLANEEVDMGKSKEGGHPVVRQPLRQWMLKITAYAERLIDDLEKVDWPPHVKLAQYNWIGKSEGANIHFDVPATKTRISVFTTRPDTLFGCTFVVLAPEHPLVGSLTAPEQQHAVAAYKEKTLAKSDLERTELNKDKSGVFTGSYAINPATGAKLPIWIADYVLATYGSGAVMSVPSHDERDFEFAKKHDLPISCVIEPVAEESREAVMAGAAAWEGEGILCNSQNSEVSLNGLQVEPAKKRIVEWLEKSGHGKKAIHYKLRDWLFSRQRYWAEPMPIMHFEDGSMRSLDIDELPLCPPQLQDYKPAGDGQSPLSKVTEWVNIVDPKTGKKAKRETNTMPQWAGSCWYYLRFCDPQNTQEAWSQEAERYWMPVDLYLGGIEHAVLHLLYARFWHKVLYDCGLVSTLEPFNILRNQGLIVARSFKDSNNHYVEPEFVTEKQGKYLHRITGEELLSQVEKMSKSKLNGITPDDIIDMLGSDSLRLYEMFMGPLEKEKIWSTDAVAGCQRFLSRAFDLVAAEEKHTDETDDQTLRLTHRLIAKVDRDIEQMMFNTSIAKMMEFVNEMSRMERYSKWALKIFAQLLSPFAPHIA